MIGVGIAVPALFDVTPHATHIAPREADEVSGVAGVAAFALERIKLLHDRKCSRAVHVRRKNTAFEPGGLKKNIPAPLLAGILTV